MLAEQSASLAAEGGGVLALMVDGPLSRWSLPGDKIDGGAPTCDERAQPTIEELDTWRLKFGVNYPIAIDNEEGQEESRLGVLLLDAAGLSRCRHNDTFFVYDPERDGVVAAYTLQPTGGPSTSVVESVLTDFRRMLAERR